MPEMEIHYAKSCRECVDRFIGPALDRIIGTLPVQKCGGCGRTVENVQVAYWFPYPTDGE